MFKRLVLILGIFPLLLFFSCRSEGTSPTVIDLATYHAADSTFSFQAPMLFERIVDEPDRIVLQYENTSNSDYSNMLIITRQMNASHHSFADFVTEEVQSRNAKGKFKLKLVEGSDSISHYRFSEGPTDIDDWYMCKKGKYFTYQIYYAGNRIDKKEATRLICSIVENDYVLPSYIQTHDGKRLYTDIDLELDASYDLVKSMKMLDFIIDKDLSNKQFYTIYTPLPSANTSYNMCIYAFEVKGDINAYFLDFIAARQKRSPCHVYTYQGNNAIEFTCYVEQRKEFPHGKTICFVHNNRFYQLTVIAATKAAASKFYYEFIESIKLV